MRVVIEIQNGVQAGHKFLLQEHERFVVGRSEWSDIALTHDMNMAHRHFSLHAQDGKVKLSDLGSATGTYINQQQVEEAWLRDGDIISAGSTQFAARIGNTQDPAAALGGPAPRSEPEKSSNGFAGQGAWSGPIPCQNKTFDSGLVRLRGGPFGAAQQPPAPSAVARVLARLRPLTLLVDPQRTGHAEVAQWPQAAPLFHWLPLDVEHPASPLILPPGSGESLEPLIDSSWDKNGLVGFYSRRPAAELVQHLRAATQLRVPADTDDDMDEPTLAPVIPQNYRAEAGERKESNSAAPSEPPTAPDALLGFCWPVVLSLMLRHSQPGFVHRLLSGIDCVLLEVPDRAQSWQLWCRAELVPELERAGFVPTNPAKDAS